MEFDPSNFISILGRKYPWCYTRLDELCQDSKYPTLDMVERLLVEIYGVEVSCAGGIAPALCGCAAWNRFKRVYVFNDILAGFLVAATDELELSAELPLDSLLHLPVSCCYVQAPNAIADTVDGFFAWVEETEDSDPVLRLVFVFDNGAFMPSSYVRLMPEKPIGDCLPDSMALTEPVIQAAANSNDRAWALLSGVPAVPGKLGNTIHNLTARAVQLLLYLVSMDADVPDIDKPDGYAVQSVSVGVQAGERLRHITAQKKVHIRQGHWHRYWIGPRNGDRREVTKWIEPCVVGDGYLKASKVTVADKDGG